MTDRPIIFSAPMVRALLDGRKTQTRRIVRADIPEGHFVEHCHFCASGWGLWERGSWAGGGRCTCREVKGIHFREGDRLWVREAWSHDGPDIETVRTRHEDALSGGIGYGPYYRATEAAPDTLAWRPSIHMPRWAPRLTLAVTEVCVERLKDISEADAIDEGLRPDSCAGQRLWDPGPPHGLFGNPRVAFRMIWEDINGPGAWDANPWVAAISFTVHRANIDALDIGAAATPRPEQTVGDRANEAAAPGGDQ